MYNYNSNNVENEREGFPWKDIIVKVLLILLFIFLLIWLVPWPKEQKQQDLSALYNQIFLDNIERMHNAAKNYYTVERMPKKVGDKVTMTLGEMLDKKLLVEFTDSDNKTCDRTKSYIELVKYDSEYALVTYLSCDKKQEQIVEYLGCKNLCPLKDCEVKDTIKPNPNPNPNPKPDPKPQVKYEYEYYRPLAYSGWTTGPETLVKPGETIKYGLSANGLTEYVKIRNQKVLAGYQITYDKTKPIYKTTYDKVIGYYTLKVCEGYKYIVTTNKEVIQVGDYVKSGEPQPYTVAPSDTTSVKYLPVRLDDASCNTPCQNSSIPYYQKYVRSTTSVGTVNNITAQCTKYSSEKVTVYGAHTTFAGYERVKSPLYVNLEYYAKKTRTITSKEEYRWSASASDTNLTKLGFKATGKRRQA